MRREVLLDMHRLRYNPYNGLYTFCLELGSAIAALEVPGMHFTYYVPKQKFGVFGNDQSYLRQRSIDKYYRFGTGRYHLWHVTTSLSWYRPFNRHTKNVFTLHDLSFLIEEKENVQRNKRLLRQMQQRVDRADHITAISRFALDFAQPYLDFGHTPTSIIYNGFRVKEFPAYTTPVYKPKSKFLFAIGLVQPRKNFHVLPALLQGNDYELVIAGLNHFDYANTIREQAKLHGVEDRVKLIGAISEQDKYWLYKHCEAFVFPSIAEGFGMPALEAMYFGKPVFLSTETSMPEIGGAVAYYFEHFEPSYMRQRFAEGMHHYHTTKPQEKIKARAAQFSWAKAAGEYVEVYRSLLPHPRSLS